MTQSKSIPTAARCSWRARPFRRWLPDAVGIGYGLLRQQDAIERLKGLESIKSQ
jgi:hypothetical protein